jgi:polysaccharide biosynthesis transport protein
MSNIQMTAASASASAGAIRWSLEDLRAALYRGRWTVAAIMLLALFSGLAFLFFAQPRYTATASVQVDQQAAKVLGTEDADPTAAIQDADRFLQTQVDLLHGREMALNVAKTLDLEKDASMAAALGVGPADADQPASRRQDELLRALDRNLDVDLPVDSRLIRISFHSRSAAASAKLANGFANAYVASSLARKKSTATASRDLLARQLDEAETSLGDAERAVAAYARQNAIIRPVAGVDGTPGTSIVDGRLSSINLAYANATARRIDAEQRWRSLSGSATASLPEAINNPAYQDLVNQRAAARTEYEDQTTRRRADHPAVRAASARMQELDRQIAGFGGGVRGSVYAEYRTALAQEQSLAGEMARMKSASFNEQDRSVQLGILERDAEKARKLYDTVLQRFNEVNAQLQGQLNNATIVGRATPPFRASGSPAALYPLLAVLLGAIASALYLLWTEMGPRKLRVPDDAQAIGLTLLGTMPNLPSSEPSQHRSLQLADSALSIVGALGLVGNGKQGTVVAVTSNDPAEGKSTTAVALASAVSATGTKTLLIDLDLRDPSIASLIDAKPAPRKVIDALVGTCPAGDAITRSSSLALDVMSGPAGNHGAGELLASGKLEALLGKLRPLYDVIVIDCPPLLDLPDSIFIGRQAEKTVIVAAAGTSRMDRVRTGIRRLLQGGVNPTGLVLNRFDAGKQGYRQRYGQPEYGLGAPTLQSGSEAR